MLVVFIHMITIPFAHGGLRIAEFALWLFGGLTINRALQWRRWRAVIGLLGLVMPLTIAAGALFGATAMALSLGTAVALGAILAPTDPVLAGTLGLGPPGDTREESDARFNLTAEAALNDGLVSPFVLLGALIIDRHGSGWLGEWAAADLLYGTVLALALGAFGGYAFGSFIKWLQPRHVLAPELDGFLVIGAVLTVYGLADLSTPMPGRGVVAGREDRAAGGRVTARRPRPAGGDRAS